jgi:hypothetical protein
MSSIVGGGGPCGAGIIPVTGREPVTLSCGGTNNLQMLSGSTIFNQDICSYSSSLSGETSGTEPGGLPA